jgi:hypothetical protein
MVISHGKRLIMNIKHIKIFKKAKAKHVYPQRNIPDSGMVKYCEDLFRISDQIYKELISHRNMGE